MRWVAPVIGLLALAACNDAPQLGLGFNVGPNGVTVAPSVSGNVGGVNVGISGPGAEL